MARPSINHPETWRLFADLDLEFLEASVFTPYEEHELTTAGDGSKTRALLYQLTSFAAELRPLVAVIHGGGFRVGSAELESRTCIGAIMAFGCVSVSLEHRLSLKFKFPIVYEDCWDALLWITKNAGALGADLTKGFVFGGTSSGAHIANPLVHRARDECLYPPITGVHLNVAPTLAPQALTDAYRDLYKSREDLKDGYTLTSKSITLYDEELQPDFQYPLWSPLLWPTGHDNLPPTFFQVCGADLLRDDALIYERELRLKHDVKTKIVVYQGLPHVFWYTHPSLRASEQFAQDTVSGLGWLLGVSAAPHSA
ncbi:alpha/beta-hydrolase [Aspergillus eucalypticola CBS 122712]|uniref:Alpha/beta-hydrolase n=1 Tax=Aspergillus eucalypticola (strain CBS 122712 / IBT 29274) TaxID=1448314 RepID=A0A317UQ08_ASPEC|nr:alpha/beta-hydrolase [Aspergillus eucalypticola CBS 122712]PWY62100.1 alpha/beta-hydrolase [Aspergillus eucalypticola CBS 122712]